MLPNQRDKFLSINRTTPSRYRFGTENSTTQRDEGAHLLGNSPRITTYLYPLMLLNSKSLVKLQRKSV